MLSFSKRTLLRLQRDFSCALVKIGLSNGWPILIAVGWRAAMRPSLRAQTRKFSRRKLVVLAKSAGNEDIEAAYSNHPAPYSVLFLPRAGTLNHSADYFLGDSVSETDYASAAATSDEAKRRYRHHLSQVLFWFRRLFGLSGVVQFNVLYWMERELAAACLGQGIPFVTVHKESNWSHGEIDNRIRLFSDALGRYEGTAIAVYNVMMKEIFALSGCVDYDRVFVPGCARLDVSHGLRKAATRPHEKIVLFYLLQVNAGIGLFRDEETGSWLAGAPLPDGSIGDWSEMVNVVNKTVLRIAADRPDIRFICKAKTGFVDEQARVLLEASSGSTLPNNVELVTGGVGHSLLERASVVIGFNSTAVLEAMAAGVPVIVPNIFSEREKQIAGFIHDVNDGALVPTSPLELRSMILRTIEQGVRYQELTVGQKHALNRLVGNSDGLSGQRLRIFLDKALTGEL